MKKLLHLFWAIIWDPKSHANVEVFVTFFQPIAASRAQCTIFFFITRQVNTTICEPDQYLEVAQERWHPHKKVNPEVIRAPITPYVSRKHRRNIQVLD